MKTLVIQLARLGDIYQTWPVLRALRRTGAAGDEIHLLVRERFRDAVEGLEAVDRLWTFSTAEVLGPLLSDDRFDLAASEAALGELIERLKGEGFGRVINLSFSPFSSRLVYELHELPELPERQHDSDNDNANGTEVTREIRGYRRHADGGFDIADDASAYFHAQVGPGSQNRVHLTDIFGLVAGVDLEDRDWALPPKWPQASELAVEVAQVLRDPVRPILVHIGASEAAKSYGAYKWLQVIKGLVETTDAPVVMIGSNAERTIAQTAGAVSSARKPLNLVGRTSLRDLFDLVAWSRLLIGADSAPVHIAALTGTPVLNLSFRTVNFWETGPKSAGSRILVFETPQDLPSDLVVQEAIAMIEGRVGDARAVSVNSRAVANGYIAPTPLLTSPSWDWLQAIYMGGPFPHPESAACVQGLRRLAEVNRLALDQLEVLGRRGSDSTALLILQRFDDILDVVARLVPTLGCLIRWFQTERVRIGPMEPNQLLERTRQVHLKLDEILRLYEPLDQLEETELAGRAAEAAMVAQANGTQNEKGQAR